MPPVTPPSAVALSSDIELRRGRRGNGFRARVRWFDRSSERRRSRSETFPTEQQAHDWISELTAAAQAGLDPDRFAQPLADYGTSVLDLALRGLEPKTTVPYLAGWRLRVLPSLGHIPTRLITAGAVDRAVRGWIADDAGRSTVKNSLAVLVRIMEQALRDGLVDRNPARITGWQRDYSASRTNSTIPAASPSLTGSPCRPSPPRWSNGRPTSTSAGATSSSSPRPPQPASVRCPAAASATLTPPAGSGPSAGRPPPSPGGLVDKGTKGKRARVVPIIAEVRPTLDTRSGPC